MFSNPRIAILTLPLMCIVMAVICVLAVPLSVVVVMVVMVKPGLTGDFQSKTQTIMVRKMFRHMTRKAAHV